MVFIIENQISAIIKRKLACMPMEHKLTLALTYPSFQITFHMTFPNYLHQKLQKNKELRSLRETACMFKFVDELP